MQICTIGSVPVVCAAGLGGDTARRVTFQGEIAESRWPLRELDDAFPSDWSSYEYLVLEIKPSLPQRFYLRIHTAGGLRALRLQPIGQGAWLRITLPLRFFRGRDQFGHDLASANNRPRRSFWFSTSGPFGNLDAVEAIEFRMEYPIAEPTLDIRLLGLAKEDPGSDILATLPVVDRFGQWGPVDWPDKAHSLEELRAAWEEEERELAGARVNASRYGGYLERRVEGSGYFRVEEIDGRWWLVDPDGYLFLSTGPNVVRPAMATPIAGRKAYFEELPPEIEDDNASFYTWNVQRRFGEGWLSKWEDLTVRRLAAWGLTTIGNWSHDYTKPLKPYVAVVQHWQRTAPYLGLPDVYADAFARDMDAAAAEECGPRREDPYLLGYFIGNEPPWPGREAEVMDMILSGPMTATRREAERLLATGDSPERRVGFVHQAFRDSLEIINAAIRKHDPNHLNLGLRFGRNPGEEIIRMASVFDVYSLNVYAYEPTAQLELAHRLSGRPVLIGEFHIGVPGNGLGAGLVQARDQGERGAAYRYYVEQALAVPSAIGAHWFQWVDQPPTGRMDGENYNIGFIDGLDRPHRQLVEAARETHSRLYAVHAGLEAPFSDKPKPH